MGLKKHDEWDDLSGSSKDFKEVYAKTYRKAARGEKVDSQKNSKASKWNGNGGRR